MASRAWRRSPGRGRGGYDTPAGLDVNRTRLAGGAAGAAVKVVAAGDALLAPSVTRRLITDFIRKPPAVPAALDVLTSRETEVLMLIAQGMPNTQISDTLCISGETTRTHIKRILSKLDLRDRAQAVVIAYETSLVTPGG